jgi:hypothetical protein
MHAICLCFLLLLVVARPEKEILRLQWFFRAAQLSQPTHLLSICNKQSRIIARLLSSGLLVHSKYVKEL